MVTAGIDSKQIVLSNSSFGPQRDQADRRRRSPRDYSQYRAPPRRGRRAGDARRTAAPPTAVRLGVCQYLLGRYSRADRNAVARPTAARWPTSTRASAICSPSTSTTRPSPPTQSAEGGRLRSATTARSARPRRSATAADAEPAPGHARQPVRRGRADGRVPLPARRHRRGPGRQPHRSRRPVRAGRRGRSRITPAPCSAWPWKTIATATTTRASTSTSGSAHQFPDARRHAAEPGRAVRRPPAVRPGPAVLPADSRRLSRITPRARLFFKDAAGLGRHVLRRGRPAAAGPH